MLEPRDECRPVTLPSGERIVLRGDGEPDAATVAMLGEVVAAARRHHELAHPPDPGAAELWARVDMVRRERGVSLREMGGECGVRFSVLFKTAQGRMPGAADRAAIEKWLEAHSG